MAREESMDAAHHQVWILASRLPEPEGEAATDD
jgi:hypothetical protein